MCSMVTRFACFLLGNLRCLQLNFFLSQILVTIQRTIVFPRLSRVDWKSAVVWY